MPRTPGGFNASLLGGGNQVTAPCKNTSAAALPQGGPVEWELGQYDEVSVQESTASLKNFAGVILHGSIPVNSATADGERGSALCVAGVCPANVLGAAGATQGAYLVPTDGEKYFTVSPTPTRIILLTDLSAESSEIVWNNSTYNPEVLILEEDPFLSTTLLIADVSTAFDYSWIVDGRAHKILGIQTVLGGVIATADAPVNLEILDGTEVFAVTIAYSGSAVGDIDSDFTAALAANALVAANTPVRITGTGASTNTIGVTITVYYELQ